MGEVAEMHKQTQKVVRMMIFTVVIWLASAVAPLSSGCQPKGFSSCLMMIRSVSIREQHLHLVSSCTFPLYSEKEKLSLGCGELCTSRCPRRQRGGSSQLVYLKRLKSLLRRSNRKVRSLCKARKSKPMRTHGTCARQFYSFPILFGTCTLA